MKRRRQRGLLIPAISTAIAFALLVTLGVWQLSRKQWKEDLIDTMLSRTLAPPEELPPPEKWAGMTAENSEFLRVKVPLEFWPTRDVYAYVAGSALRDDIKSPGYYVFRPGRTRDGRMVVVNRGYIPIDYTAQSPTGEQEITGYLRWPEPKSMFVSSSDDAGQVWFVRDHRAMAVSRGWGEVAPFYIDQQSPVPPGDLPRPATLKLSLRNDHLGYALTWFGLAATLVGVFGAWALAQRRAKSRGDDDDDDDDDE